jgi:hypothetical protein
MSCTLTRRKENEITEANNSIPQEICSTYGLSADVFVICKFKEIILACFLPLRDTVEARCQTTQTPE